jgi:phosphoribosylformylglycinamidine synthase subunit PurSL
MWRLEVTERAHEAASVRLARKAARMLGCSVSSIVKTELYFVDRLLSTEERTSIQAAVVNAKTHAALWVCQPSVPSVAVEIALRPGVTDPFGDAFALAVSYLGLAPLQARSGTQFRFPDGTDDALIRAVTEAVLRNDIVDEVSYGVAIEARFVDAPSNTRVETVAVRTLIEAELAWLSRQRGLALDPAELAAVQQYFSSIDRDPTDAEIETIAQTWSEHCSHKTFRASITWDDGTAVEPLLKQLRRSTDEIAAPWVRSAFVDNAGIVAFDDGHDLAIKVETHNHPSAVEPFGGANTGVGGVIRDVLGVAADPIAVTDILCFGPLDTRADQLPAGVLHPQRVRDGVVAGVADYGNKLGLPTVAGAIVHQEGFTANPLVFAGCIGLRPAGLVLSGQQPGERIVVLGGATGRDGIRGATFSSETMDASTGDVAGASVQIGDPIIEKLVADVLSKARDANLFTAITDCGAGGFSSAVGEIAAELGADVCLDDAPRKYPGLAPWEVWLSEAQERMVVAVKPENLAALKVLCDDYDVPLADLGSFRSDGQLVVTCGGQTIVDLPGRFLHDGRPTRQMVASRSTSPVSTGVRNVLPEHYADVLKKILSHSDVRSNEDVVRGYDHEILGATIGRPYLGVANDGPSDAAVLAPLKGTNGRGIAIGIGMNCRTGVIDARRMAEAAVDEAIRNVVAVGADPAQLSLLDNFSWGDPRRPTMLGSLVDAVAGCVAGANQFGAPFVSGKDSLNNEYSTVSGERRSIPPTLVITALGVLPNADLMVTSDVKKAGNVLVVVGNTLPELRGSVLDAVLGVDGPGSVPGGDALAPARYAAVHQLIQQRKIRAAHDVSDGGLMAALAEMAIGGRLGISADLTGLASDPIAVQYSESSGRLILEIDPADAEVVCVRTNGVVIGNVVAEPVLSWRIGSGEFTVGLGDLVAAWRGHVEGNR